MVADGRFLPQFFLLSRRSCFLSTAANMPENTLSAVFRDPTTIHFIPGTDDANLRGILAKNPQRTPDGYVWYLPDQRTEAMVTFVGKVIYGAIGDKTGPYFSLPDKVFVRTFPSCPSVFHRLLTNPFRLKTSLLLSLRNSKSGSPFVSSTGSL